MKIKTKLIFTFLIVSLLPLLFVSFFSVINSRATMKDLIGNNFENLAKEKANAIEFIFQERVNEAQTLASLPVIVDAVKVTEVFYNDKSESEIKDYISSVDLEWIADKANSPVAKNILNNEVSGFLKAYQGRDPKYGEIFLTDTRGATVAMTKTLSDYYQADEGWWQGGFANGRGGLFLDDRGYDESVDAVVVGVVVPVIDRGKVVGILKINYKIEEVLNIISSHKFSQRSEIFLARSQGDLIVYSGLFPKENLNEHEQKIAGSFIESGWAEEAYEGQKTITAFAPIDNTDLSTKVLSPGARPGISGEKWELTKWFVFVETFQDEAFEAINKSGNIIIGVGVFIGIMILFLAVFLARSIAGPIKKLTKTIDNISKGELNEKVDPELVKSKDELGDLAKAFERTVTSLKLAMRKNADESNKKI